MSLHRFVERWPGFGSLAIGCAYGILSGLIVGFVQVGLQHYPCATVLVSATVCDSVSFQGLAYALHVVVLIVAYLLVLDWYMLRVRQQTPRRQLAICAAIVTHAVTFAALQIVKLLSEI
jgi:hypothetical protein